MLSFLASIIVPFFAVYDTSIKNHHVIELFGDKVLICEGKGFRLVSSQELEDIPNNTSSTMPQCGICFLSALHIDNYVSSATGLTNIFSYQIKTEFEADKALPPLSAYHIGSHSRAPPIIS